MTSSSPVTSGATPAVAQQGTPEPPTNAAPEVVRRRLRPRPRMVHKGWTTQRPAPGVSTHQPGARPAPAVPRRAVTPGTYRTQIIPFWVIAWIWIFTVWVLTIASFAVGVVGNIGLFGASAAALWADPRGYASTIQTPLGAALIFQVIVQAGQVYAVREYGRTSLLYRGLIAASVAPSLWTYGVILVPWAGSTVLWGDALPIRALAYAGSMGALLIVLVLNDMLQEWVLVKR